MTSEPAGQALRAAILAAADAVEAAREALCELDASTGDGDHGVTMTIGARGVRRQLEATESDDPAALVRAAAIGMTGAGGAIGPIYGRGLLAIVAELGRPEEAARGGTPSEAAGGGAPSQATALSARCLAAAVDAVTAIGGATAGDKTILDAALPALAALERAADHGESLVVGGQAAAAAARAGAVATTDMVATIGRSSRFGERSRGTADPGATSFAIIVEALSSTAVTRPDR